MTPPPPQLVSAWERFQRLHRAGSHEAPRAHKVFAYLYRRWCK